MLGTPSFQVSGIVATRRTIYTWETRCGLASSTLDALEIASPRFFRASGKWWSEGLSYSAPPRLRSCHTFSLPMHRNRLLSWLLSSCLRDDGAWSQSGSLGWPRHERNRANLEILCQTGASCGFSYACRPRLVTSESEIGATAKSPILMRRVAGKATPPCLYATSTRCAAVVVQIRMGVACQHPHRKAERIR